MITIYQKKLDNSKMDLQRQNRINASLEFKAANKFINRSTGEVKEPLHSRFNKKSRRDIKKKLDNLNSVPNRVRSIHGSNLKFYTLLLKDIYPVWGEYDTVFQHTRMTKVKNHIKRHIQGPFFGVFELSSWSGTHVHLVCKEQESIFAKNYLKAMKDVHNFEGLVMYLSKSSISKNDLGTEEEDVIQGTYLEHKAQMMGKRCPVTSIYRIKE